MRPTLWPGLTAAPCSTVFTPPPGAGLARSPSVAWVEPDRVVTVAQQTTPTGIDRVEADLNPATLPMDIDIAIIDTGLSFPHEDILAYRATDCTGAIFYPLFGGCTGSGNLQDGP